LFKSAALNDSLSFVIYSLVSFLSNCPADAAAINSLKSSLPSLLMSIEFKNESTSIAFPRLYKRVFNSSFDKNPSLFTSAVENCSFNFLAYSLDSFFEKWPAEAAAINSLKSSLPSLLISILSSNSFTLTLFPRLFSKFSSSSLLR